MPGDTLRIFGGEPTTLDPALVQDTTSATYVVELFSGLVTLNEELRVAPDLAQSWDIDSSGTIYTFDLREDAQFHNGEPVRARDVKASLERACNPLLASPVALSYLGDIVGVQEVISGEATEIAGIRIIDDLVLEITIDSPKAYFLSKLTYPVAFVVSPSDALRVPPDQLVGTGPFKLASVGPDVIELERNPLFYKEPAQIHRARFVLGGGLPITMYETGQLDMAPVGVADIERVRDPANPLNQELVAAPGLNVQYIGLNVEMPPFDDVDVRRAFVHATDRTKLARVVLKGMAEPARGILPPSMPGYNPDLQGLAYDPSRARDLIRQSKYESVDEFPPIVLHITGDVTGPPRSIQALLAMWEENLGVQVMVEAVDWPTFLNEVNERRYPMYFLGWVADYPDPHNFLDLLFSSTSAENHTNYQNAQLDRLLLEAGSTLDTERRLEIYQQAERIVVEDAVWIPLWHDEDYYLVKPYVKGVPKTSSIVPWLRQVYFESN